MKQLFVILFVLVLVGTLSFGVCDAAPTAVEEIRIGASESLTGMYSGFAAGGSFGMKAAVEDINRQGGVFVKEYNRKLPMKLIILNNESDQLKAGSLAQNLITRNKIHALVNSPGPSYLFVPQAIVAERHKIPYLAGFGPLESWMPTRNAASPPWEYVWGFGFAIVTPPPPGDFRAGKPGYSIADTWAGFLEMFGPETNKKMAMFAADDADGRGWYAGNPPVLQKIGYDVVGVNKKLGLYPLGTMYYSPMIKQWKEEDCEILWGMAPGPDFGTMWRQARTMGWVPKIAMVAKAPLFFEEVSSWGGDLPMGVGTERWWDPAYPADSCPGIGGTTPQSLFERWYDKTGKALNQGIGWGYVPIQVLANAIERAGTLDATAISEAIGETDMLTISHRAVFTKEEHHCRLPLTYGQWMKVDKPWVWECPIVLSRHEFIKATAQPVYPIPK